MTDPLPSSGDPFVLAHRGASGYRPEHTLVAYRLGMELGADGLEVDVVATSDGHLVCRHEHEISSTTDVADRPEFADRRTVRHVPGRAAADGWFVEDFTLAELRTLRTRERMPKTRPGNTSYNDVESIPTFAEVLALVAELRQQRRCTLWAELKQPSYLGTLGHDLPAMILAELAAAGLDGGDADVTLECFEPTILQRLATMTTLPRVQLLEVAEKRPADLVALDDPRTYGDLAGSLDHLAEYATALGVHTTHVLAMDAAGALDHETALVGEAARRGLPVSVFTLRAENRFLPQDFRLSVDPPGPASRGDLPGFSRRLLQAGVAGLIADQPDLVERAPV